MIAAAIAACLDYLASEPRRARLLLVDAATAGRSARPAIDEALDAGTRLVGRALADTKLPKVVAPAMTGGIAELAAGWILEGRAAQLPELRGPLIEIVLTPSLGLAAAMRAAEEALRDICAEVIGDCELPDPGRLPRPPGPCHRLRRYSHHADPVHGRLSTVVHDGSQLFAGIPREFEAVRYHSLRVVEPLPSELKPIAWSDDGVVMALRHRSRLQWGVQFHPEAVCTEYGRR